MGKSDPRLLIEGLFIDSENLLRRGIWVVDWIPRDIKKK